MSIENPSRHVTISELTALRELMDERQHSAEVAIAKAEAVARAHTATQLAIAGLLITILNVIIAVIGVAFHRT